MKLNTTMMTMVLAAGTMAFGQGFGAKVLEVRVPFEFHAAGVTFAAGDYNVVSSHAGQRMIVRSMDGKAAAMAITTVAGSKERSAVPKLVFNRYGDRYFLTQIWSADSARQELGAGKLEQEIARAAGSKPVQHPVIASRAR